MVSEPGRGSTFTVALPSVEARSHPADIVEEPTLPPGLRVLVVEDQREFGDILREFLGSKGCAVAIVSDGRAAREAPARHPEPLRGTHLVQPRGSGGGLCRVILMSGKSVPEELWIEALVDACLMKPIDLSKLLGVIAEVLNGVPRRDA